MANNFKIYASSKTYVYADDTTYENSTFRQSGGVPNNTASAFAVNTALYCASIITKTLIDAMAANSSFAVYAGVTTSETDLRNMFASMLSQLSVAKASQWTTSRSFTIKDADATNSGTAISVNGTSAVTLKLPSTIKASLTGTASNASKIGNKTFSMTYDSTTSTLNITYTD